MADAGCRRADALDRLLARDGRIREVVLLINGTLERIRRKRLVGLTLRLPQHEDRGHQHVARFDHTRCKHGVGVQRRLSIRYNLVQFGVAGRLVAAGVARAKQTLDLADKTQARIYLRLDKKHRMNDGLGFCLGQLVDQFCVDVARPRPAADVGDALVVDRNDRNAVGRLT